MYKKEFGTLNQIKFNCAEDYYEFLGFLSKPDNSTKLVWEKNDEQGAWGQEGRIHFYREQPSSLKAKLRHTAGVGNVISRVNCNDFLIHIAQHHNLNPDKKTNVLNVKKTIPKKHFADFERGFSL